MPPPAGRIYVNRSVSMSKTKAIGFDMDYTLVGERRAVVGGSAPCFNWPSVPPVARELVMWLGVAVPPLPLCCPEYKSPEYETLSYSMIVRRLIDVGYPKVRVLACVCQTTRSSDLSCAGSPATQGIETIAYDADFPVRLVDRPSLSLTRLMQGTLCPTPLYPSPASCRGLCVPHPSIPRLPHAGDSCSTRLMAT